MNEPEEGNHSVVGAAAQGSSDGDVSVGNAESNVDANKDGASANAEVAEEAIGKDQVSSDTNAQAERIVDLNKQTAVAQGGSFADGENAEIESDSESKVVIYDCNDENDINCQHLSRHSTNVWASGQGTLTLGSNSDSVRTNVDLVAGKNCCTDRSQTNEIGCEVADIQTCVCSEDSFCCSDSWDKWCVKEVALCGGLCIQ